MSDGPQGWGTPLYARVLDALPAGATVLDVGCGAGEFARTAVDRGHAVRGVDADASAVAVAARRVPEGVFAVGDAQSLAQPDSSYDAVALVQLVTHVANPLAALREAARVVRSSGTVVVTVWGRESECDIRLIGESLAGLLPPRRPAPGGPPPLTEPDRLEKIVGMAGLTVSSVDEVVCPFRYDDEDELVGPVLGSGLGRTAARRGGPGGVRTAILDGMARFRRPDGSYVLDNLFRVLTARPR
ncbi:bifunctional 2-polyprenyl-6-hydroxyphenol methylase/3-demethylubiquinol 3-O-methyltransferase UbiG [Pseudonocardia sp. N23]|uniref:class I SAM-dependent methyltransferase n=1 Tax=Pseudonocardia sp. N23 TaxID=1987376 RepID=UPI000BFB2400|nr:class I SAM-dependent methyltransferase [Pseudonocardia sp. N23]GAY08409.1 gamma-tocopherol methyltransferase [Pseudonocardia sp. N23]